MLQHVPAGVGRILKNVRPGMTKLFYYDPVFEHVPETITVTSPVFADGKPLPVEYTADGMGISPPVRWQCVPSRAEDIVLIMEDADSPTPAPLTHTVLAGLPGSDGELGTGDIEPYTPPDPPPGHGPHRYVFQVFALDRDVHGKGSKKSAKEAMRGHVLARGRLTGIYERSAPMRDAGTAFWQVPVRSLPGLPLMRPGLY